MDEKRWKQKHGSIWARSSESGQFMSIYSEGIAAAEAERDPDTIFFFAELEVE